MTFKPPEQENPHPDWKKCKLLGSLLDTKSDIQRRKGLTLDSLKAFDFIFNSKRIGIDLKIRTFNTYSASIFLYNTELWTLTETSEDEVDSFHRRLLRKVINIRWPKVISNKDLYEKVGVEKWSVTIRRRRLNWLGHLMRLDEGTPVRKSLLESLTDIKRKVGRPQLTWLKAIEKDLASVGIDIDVYGERPERTVQKLVDLTENRNEWKKIVRDIMVVNC